MSGEPPRGGASLSAVPAMPAWATLVRAPNPGPMTLDGTNTWVLRVAGAAGCIVVDPGPLDGGHLAGVASHGPVELILLTHGHPDHAEGAHRFQQLTGAPLAAVDPSLCVGAEVLRQGAGVEAAGLLLRMLATPGHSSDSACFVVEAVTAEPGTAEPGTAVLTGDTILGRGTTVVAHPDGVLADYLRSLEILSALATMPVLPGHGPVLPDVGPVARDYLRHRAERLAQVRAAVAAGARTPAEVVRAVYVDVDPALWEAAELSVAAQLAYLRG